MRGDIRASFQEGADQKLETRVIECEDGPDENSTKIRDWVNQDKSTNVPLAKNIVTTEVGDNTTIAEFLHCANLAPNRAAAVTKYDF